MKRFSGMIDREPANRARRRLIAAANLAELESKESGDETAADDIPEMGDKKRRTFMSALLRALHENPDIIAALGRAKKSPAKFKESWDALGNRIIALRDK